MVAENFDEAIKTAEDKEYILPDGNKLAIKSERIRVAEALFDPTIVGQESDRGVHKEIFAAIGKSDMELRRDLLQSIILTGGSTCFEGIANRLLKEVTRLVPTENKVMVLPLPDRQFSAWLGASYLASLHSFES